MKVLLCSCFLALRLCAPGSGEALAFEDELLDRLVGRWVMTGTIGGDEITHDVVAEWVLNHHYLRFTEVAREKKETGDPAYEAIVFIGWDVRTDRYVCLWLDETGGDGIASQVLGYAERSGDEIAWVFDTRDGSAIHNTFTYERPADLWHWAIDMVRAEGRSEFARVTLARP